jgi:hypothetical protein
MSDVKYSEAELRDGNLLGFDDVGKPIAASGLPSVPVTPFAQTLLDDADATTALSTLGVSAYAKTLLDDATAAAARETIGLGGYVNVKQFGAVGDGWTDDKRHCRTPTLPRVPLRARCSSRTVCISPEVCCWVRHSASTVRSEEKTSIRSAAAVAPFSD